jgi:hypothetical protein
MVDGVYYGRGEKKRIRLTDPQVLRYHAQRRSAEEQTLGLLDEEIARDPIPVEAHRRGHLYLVARPLTAPRAVARSLVWTPDPGMKLLEIARSAEPRMASSGLAQRPPSPHRAAVGHSSLSWEYFAGGLTQGPRASAFLPSG